MRKQHSLRLFAGILLTGLFLLTGTAFAAPTVAVEEIVINRTLNTENLDEINIRVNTVNTSTVAVESPIIHLWVRENPQTEWRLLRTWDEEPDINAGERLSRDFFAIGTGDADPALFAQTFEVRAEVRANGNVMATREAVHIEQ